MNFDNIDDLMEEIPPSTSGMSALDDLEMSKVYPNPDQPRKYFDQTLLEELAESITTHGLLQPISVVRKPDGYMIVAGERRWRAHGINEAVTIKAIVYEKEDHAIDELALVENIHRADLTDFERAKAIGRMWASGRYKKKQDLGAAIGKRNKTYLSKVFSCLKLDSSIVSDLEEARRDIGLSILEEISRIKDKAVQGEVYALYVAGEITRDDFAKFVKPKEKVSLGKQKDQTQFMFGIIDVLVFHLHKASLDRTQEAIHAYSIKKSDVELWSKSSGAEDRLEGFVDEYEFVKEEI